MNKTVKAVFILTGFTVIERMLGFLFKVYLSREIGAVGMGIYSVALSFFFVLLTLLTSGIPLVTSKLTAKDKTLGGAVCSAALIIELAVSAAVCGAVLLLNRPIGSLFADRTSMTLVIIMLPALVFSGIYSAFRGVLWGEKKFTSVSVVELIEQVARIVCCIVLMYLFKNKLYAVALSMSAACLVSAGACAIFFFAGKRRLKSPKTALAPLFKTSLPITLSRTTSSVNSYLTAVTVPFLLMSGGLNGEQSMYVFGSCIGMALPLVYLPITVVGSLAFVMIPTLSEAYSRGDKKSTQSQIEGALGFATLIAGIILPVFVALGEPLGTFIYNNTDAGIFLKKAAWLVLPLSFENIASSMLNSLDLEKKSLINYLIGAVSMYAVCFAFYSHFNMDVYMAAFGGSLILSSVLDIIDIKRRTGIKLSFFRPLVICLAASYPAMTLTSLVYSLLPGNILPIFIAGAGGICFAALAAVLFGAIDFEGSFVSRKHLRRGKSKTSPMMR